MTNEQINIFKILLIVSIMSFIGVSFSSMNNNKLLELDKQGVYYIESITSGIQRISKIEFESGVDEKTIKEIDDICENLYSNGTNHCFNENPEIILLVHEVIADWEEFKKTILEYRETKDRNILFLASENNYDKSIEIIEELNEYIDQYAEIVDNIEKIAITNVVVIMIILVKILSSTYNELQRNKEMSKEMYIDSATGIYNAAKCHEIMKTLPSDTLKNRAVIIFDLNDLKKTNDSLGHRSGDELISNFATEVKEASNIFNDEIFVGRYGGDEFMSFLEEIEENDVKNYIEEVFYRLERFNETQNKPYRLSCAAGYGISTVENKSSISVKELFDIADEDMYKNKIAMKEKRKQELIEQGVNVIEEVDERL